LKVSAGVYTRFVVRLKRRVLSARVESATNKHALPCACRWLAFLCPTWQRPASSTMESVRVHSLFLLENSALKFKWCGEAKQTWHISKPVSIRGISSSP